jgi:hypothetical protein
MKSSAKLQEMAALRSLQSLAAESKAGQAAAVARAAKDQVDQSGERRAAIHLGWTASLSSGPIGWVTRMHWASAWQRADTEHLLHERHRDTADGHERAARELWHMADLKKEAARSHHRTALREEAHARDEQQLHETAERFTRKPGVSK